MDGDERAAAAAILDRADRMVTSAERTATALEQLIAMQSVAQANLAAVVDKLLNRDQRKLP
jgi:hypothetical protein